MSALAVLGLLAGIASVADTVPYVRDVLRGATRPHRGTWLIWSVLAAVACISQRADGASWSLVLSASQALVTGVVFLLAIRRGVGGVSVAELGLMAIAGAGVVGWLVADEPAVATVCVVLADLVGVGLMVPKTWRNPCSETLATYVIASVSGALATGAVGKVDAALLLYPLYFLVVNAAIALLIHARRRTAGHRAARHPAVDAAAAPRREPGAAEA